MQADMMRSGRTAFAALTSRVASRLAEALFTLLLLATRDVSCALRRAGRSTPKNRRRPKCRPHWKRSIGWIVR
jgi:hypothetical protein